ncbi:hypothetical protein ACNQR7_32195 [Mycolicibacterium senegalense]|uniref:hypothetical protein n=1 Tax=Mycolicibacterium senegalense TaxID=1796 RepID=UPI003AAFCDE3
MNKRALANAIHAIPFQALATALPDFRPFNDVHYELRREFASWTLANRAEFDTWQDAFNAWAGATPNRPGRITLTVKCPRCHGRLYAIQHGRVGPCMNCHGRRNITLVSAARYQQH